MDIDPSQAQGLAAVARRHGLERRGIAIRQVVERRTHLEAIAGVAAVRVPKHRGQKGLVYILRGQQTCIETYASKRIVWASVGLLQDAQHQHSKCRCRESRLCSWAGNKAWGKMLWQIQKVGTSPPVSSVSSLNAVAFGLSSVSTCIDPAFSLLPPSQQPFA